LKSAAAFVAAELDRPHRAWEQFIPFLEFDKAIRKVIYTTNVKDPSTTS
jgi:transposase-like protein